MEPIYIEWRQGPIGPQGRQGESGPPGRSCQCSSEEFIASVKEMIDQLGATINERLDKMEIRLNELETHVKYMPNGSGFNEAMFHFTSLSTEDK